MGDGAERSACGGGPSWRAVDSRTWGVHEGPFRIGAPGKNWASTPHATASTHTARRIAPQDGEAFPLGSRDPR